MDRNLLLAFALSFLVLSLWSMMQEAPPQPAGERPAGEAVDATAPPPPQREVESAGRYPELGPGPEATASSPPVQRPSGTEIPREPARSIEIEREHYRASLSSQGGTLRFWELTGYDDANGEPIHLVNRDDRDPSAATPFLELERGDLTSAIWQVESESPDEVAFLLVREGVTLRKVYRLSPDGYSVRLRLDVRNDSRNAIAPAFLVEWPIQERAGNDFREQSAAALHDGELEVTPLAGIGSAGFTGWMTGASGGEPEVFPGEIDWAGVHTPYFLSALFPDQPAAANARFVALEQGSRGAVQIYFDPVTLMPGQAASREYRAFLGPKEPRLLEAFAPSAMESIDLGWSVIAPMTRLFGWMLAVLYSFVPNYGVAIILLTLLVRLVTAPLTVKQMKSMERMRRIQPKMKEIQEKFADDRQKQSEAMMSLYRQEKVNPLGGCLPMLLQLPVFIGLFYALRSSIQLRHAPFFGWIDDLSAPDLLFTLPGVDFPVRVLPVLMGASMVVQQKITPMQMDPAQAKMMMTIMPIMMTVISYTFPSGLVLYWMMSNVLAISHQLWIGRNMEPAGK